MSFMFGKVQDLSVALDLRGNEDLSAYDRIPRRFWPRVFCALFPQYRLPTPEEEAERPTEWLNNLRFIIDTLSFDILRMELGSTNIIDLLTTCRSY